MSLFSKAGATFEEARQAYLGAAEVAFVCTACEQEVAEAAASCPHCGADAVEPVE